MILLSVVILTLFVSCSRLDDELWYGGYDESYDSEDDDADTSTMDETDSEN